MVMFLILGLVDITAGAILFGQTSIAKYIGLFLIWKGVVTLFYYLKSKLK